MCCVVWVVGMCCVTGVAWMVRFCVIDLVFIVLGLLFVFIKALGCEGCFVAGVRGGLGWFSADC